ncbi:MAG: amidohydrolase family protein [Bacillota bacterium]
MTRTAVMPVVDLRLRPPLGSFLKAKMFALIERSARMGLATGMTPAPSALERSFEKTLQEMDEAGVVVAIMPGMVRATPLDGQISNDELARIQQESGGRFVGLGAINPLDGKQALAEIDRCVHDYGFPGIAMEPGLLPTPLYVDDRRLYPIYRKCEDEGIPVLLMTGGNAGPDPSYMSPTALDHVLADFPSLQVIAAHGSWPYVTEVLHVAFRRPNLYISPDLYTFMPGGDLYIQAAATYLQDRFLYGSAYPFLPIIEPVGRLKASGPPPEILEKVFYKNAARLFKLDVGAATA